MSLRYLVTYCSRLDSRSSMTWKWKFSLTDDSSWVQVLMSDHIQPSDTKPEPSGYNWGRTDDIIHLVMLMRRSPSRQLSLIRKSPLTQATPEPCKTPIRKWLEKMLKLLDVQILFVMAVVEKCMEESTD